ncbi:RDD family protein [Streptacidiphilus sp. EB129]|uniref:RDD family protein n=1 Tax=Streptacidiphilus sp. EB129 TaxID=3156262 RepID=UPI003513CFD3
MSAGDWWVPGAAAVVPPARGERRPRVPIPGLADWSARASATLIEISIVGGIATAYGYALYLARPVFALVEAVALLAGVGLQPVFGFLYWGLGVAFLVWQWALRGSTGQSLGQRLLRIVTVDEDTGAPIGPARSIVRSVLHVVDIAPVFFGYVRPLFQYRRQTWADQICRTVVVKVETINAIAQVRP